MSIAAKSAAGAQRITAAPFKLDNYNCYVDGKWVGADSGKTYSVTNPADGDVLALVPDMGKTDTEKAIAAATKAWPAWSKRTGHERAAILRKMYDITIANIDGIAVLLSAECGKPFEEAKGEVKYAADYLEFYSEEARRSYGEVLVSPNGARRQVVLMQSIGPAALLTPWNFSAAMPARKIAPALAAGCTVVLRPSVNTPLCALVFAKIAELAGVPPGVLNVIVGEDHASTAGVLTASPDIAKLSFTGSTRVGKLLQAACAPTLKRTSMELGGKAPFIVFEDADVDAAIEGAVASKFRNAGQTCVCANTFYVHAKHYHRFLEGFTAKVAAIKVGDGLVAGVQMGPLITEAALKNVQRLVDDAVAKGAKVRTGGKTIAKEVNGGKGHFYAPTVLEGATQDMECVKHEIFGPVAPVASFSDEQQLLSMLSSDPNRMGLSAYFYTRDVSKAWRVAEDLSVGIVGVNTGLVSAANAPFGGVRESGFGREGARQGLAEYLQPKYIMMVCALVNAEGTTDQGSRMNMSNLSSMLGMSSSSQGQAGGTAEQGARQHELVAKGDKLSMRMWRVSPGDTADDPSAQRNYSAQHDSVCYCVSGSGELHVEGSCLKIYPGDSWSVPAKAEHTYKVTSSEPFCCVEACHPAAP